MPAAAPMALMEIQPLSHVQPAHHLVSHVLTLLSIAPLVFRLCSTTTIPASLPAPTLFITALSLVFHVLLPVEIAAIRRTVSVAHPFSYRLVGNV